MDDNKRIQAKQDRNQELREEIKKKDALLTEKKAEAEKSKQKLNQMEHQFNAMKDSKAWHLLRRMKGIVKKSLAYLTGRRNIKQLFKSTKEKKAKKQVKRLKYSLYELGFIDKALADLENAVQKTDNSYFRQLAAWELALWHANKYTEDGARKSLDWLVLATKGVKDKDFLRRAAIIRAEGYEVLNEIEAGKAVIEAALETQTHADLYFAAANLEETITERMKWINKALDLYDIAPIEIHLADNQVVYNGLTTGQIDKKTEDGPKVSVIIPAYNSEDGIHLSLDSILTQTWSNLEVLVVDDCSTDNTTQVVEAYAQKDSRVKLLSTGINSGPYVARNIALQAATGEFITVNDADDWSHAEKIEAQVEHLMASESVIANTTQHARLTEELKFYRRGQPGAYIFPNMSSLLFRRKPVMEKLGFWDSVRFGADGEFKRRLIQEFGKENVVDLKTGPYSLPRQSVGSLTGSSVFGYNGYFMGARKEYAQSHQYYHSIAETLYLPFQQDRRPFPVPEPMWPQREEKSLGRRHFDVIIASEFRLLGGTNMSNIEEIKAQKKLGLRTGLIQMNRYDIHSVKETNPKVRELIDGEHVQMLVYGEKVTCDVLIVRHPPILQEWQKYIPEIEARHVRVIINQPPKREYSEKGQTLYDIKRCVGHLNQYVGKSGKWYPIGPKIRETLEENHRKELKSIKLASEDWVNIIDVEEWRRRSLPENKKIRIGRHSRDQYVKWPSDKSELLRLYPDSGAYEIHVLGGAKAPEKVLGKLPSNWHVHAFGDIDPKDFLTHLDVFVYYTHPDWVEAFGRVIFEAMAVGVPVIIPPSYEELFGEAAIYAEPQEVKGKIDQLMQDDETYKKQVDKALHYVENHFGYTKHAARLEDSFVEDIT